MTASYRFIERLGHDDQCLWQDDYGLWYLCDNSGSTPTTTDDGPLQIDLSLPIVVGLESCSVRVKRMVLNLKNEHRLSVMLSHAAAWTLTQHIPSLTLSITRPALSFAHLVLRASSNALPIHEHDPYGANPT
jgi:hypothetical protein